MIIGIFATSPKAQNSLLIILFFILLIHNQIWLKYTNASYRALSNLKILESFLYLLLSIILLVFSVDNSQAFLNQGATVAISVFFLLIYFG